MKHFAVALVLAALFVLSACRAGGSAHSAFDEARVGADLEFLDHGRVAANGATVMEIVLTNKGHERHAFRCAPEWYDAKNAVVPLQALDWQLVDLAPRAAQTLRFPLGPVGATSWRLRLRAP